MQKAHRLRKLWVAVGVVLAFLAGASVASFYFLELQPAPPAPQRSECRAPRVRVESGELLGLCRPANPKTGIPQYAAFLGVPYAQPPLGELRFKAPRPVKPWQGVREAVLFDQRCLQGEVTTMKGSEDCLHVNVYSPWLQKSKNERGELLAVIVHVHGGTMKEGSGNIIRPDYFVAKDLVVVTFNYRLGHMGFFSLDSDLAPGNAGFKDMVAALRWVNKNIKAFGGDPEKVTIQGCSSAAAAVHWLTLLPDTEGLFRGAIIKSGSALLSWAYAEHSHLDLSSIAMDFFRKYYPNNTDTQTLHDLSAVVLELGISFAEGARPKITPATSAPPTVALESRPDGGEEPKLILKDGEAYILEPARSRVPIIMGMTLCEYNPAGIMYYMLGQLPDINSPLLEPATPRSIIPTDFAMEALGIDPANYSYTFGEVTDDIRHQLFNVSLYDTSCDLVCRWDTFFSDALIKADTARSIRMHAREEKAPVYAYRYDFPINGYCPLHATEDKKVWPEDEVDVWPLNTTNPVALNILRQVTLFSNFVKFGKPVPQTDDTILPVEWTPMVKGQPDEFLRIDANLTMEKGDILGTFGPFWQQLYNKYRGGGDQISGQSVPDPSAAHSSTAPMMALASASRAWTAASTQAALHLGICSTSWRVICADRWAAAVSRPRLLAVSEGAWFRMQKDASQLAFWHSATTRCASSTSFFASASMTCSRLRALVAPADASCTQPCTSWLSSASTPSRLGSCSRHRSRSSLTLILICRAAFQRTTAAWMVTRPAFEAPVTAFCTAVLATFSKASTSFRAPSTALRRLSRAFDATPCPSLSRRSAPRVCSSRPLLGTSVGSASADPMIFASAQIARRTTAAASALEFIIARLCNETE